MGLPAFMISVLIDEGTPTRTLVLIQCLSGKGKLSQPLSNVKKPRLA